MKIWDIYKTESKSRQDNVVYVRIIDIFKPWTYQYNFEKEKLWSDWKSIKWIFVKYERSDNLKFEYIYTNYMKRTDFLYNFKKINL